MPGPTALRSSISQNTPNIKRPKRGGSRFMRKQVMLRFIVLLLVATCVSTTAFGEVRHGKYKKQRQCVKCHPMYYPTHKPNVPVQNRLNLPLSKKGKLTCFTCHKREGNTVVLRHEPKKLCYSCHINKDLTCATEVAHLGSKHDENLGISMCLSCHDGSITKSIAITHSHKVNISYRPSKDLALPRDSRIVLTNRKITCLTCHNPYVSREKKLVMSDTNAICTSCHINKA